MAWLALAAAHVCAHVAAIDKPFTSTAGQSRGVPSVLAVGAVTVGRNFSHADLSAHTTEWVDEGGRMGFDAMLEAQRNGLLRFSASPEKATVRNLEGQRALWLKFSLSYAQDVENDQYLTIPLSYLDEVQFYIQEPNGAVQRFVAGDTVNIKNWPEITRYAALKLHPLVGGQRTVYLRISQGTRTTLPIWLSDSAQFHHEERLDLLLFGAMAGALLLLLSVCLLQAYVYRDKDFVRFAGFSLLLLLGASTYCGITTVILPYQTQIWADASQAVMLCLAAGGGLSLIHLVLMGSGASRLFLRGLRYSAWACVPLALVVALVNRPFAANIISAYVLVCVASAVCGAWAAWRMKSRVALWLTLAFMPLLGLVVIISARLAGFAIPVWLSNHAMMLGNLIHLPLMFMALSVRSRDRHVAEARAEALGRQDALTGLLVEHVFSDRLGVACSRFERTRESAAVVVFRIANFHRLREKLGVQVSDELLLRATIRLRRVITDSENLARLGEARFGLIVEGVTDRAVIQELCARLIAVGLMPIKGLPKGITLNFQCAVIVFSEHYLDANHCLVALNAKLDTFSSRTRRPIRFLEASHVGGRSNASVSDDDLPGTAGGHETSAFAPSSQQLAQSTLPQPLVIEEDHQITEPAPLLGIGADSSAPSDFDSLLRPSTNQHGDSLPSQTQAAQKTAKATAAAITSTLSQPPKSQKP